MIRRAGAVAALVVIAWGATMGAAEARDPTPLPAEYPESGPTTTTTTIPVQASYPDTSPTTTAPPTTTTTAPPSTGYPTTPTTVAPTPAPAPTPRPAPAPAPTEAEDDEVELEEGEVPPILDGSTVIVYETTEEHAIAIANASVEDAESYALFSAPDDVRVTSDGMVQWRPGEDHGGRTIVISVMAEAEDGSHARVDVHFLVAETNSEPEVVAPAVFRGFPGKTTQAQFTFIDADVPENDHFWFIAGHAGLEIDQSGTVSWTLPDDAQPGVVEITVSVLDDGDPAERGSLTLMAEIVDTSEAAVMAVDAEGAPVNPMVIGADEAADAPAMMVDLDEPAQLMTALADRTPQAAASRTGPNSRVEKVTGTLQNTIVVQSVQETLGVLLELEVPTTAVAGGLAWQLALLIAPSTFGRSRKVYDIVGVAPGAEIGDDRFRFRSDASGLEAGPLRRRGGRWMRAVESPFGEVWIPAANLRAAGRTAPGALEVRLGH